MRDPYAGDSKRITLYNPVDKLSDMNPGFLLAEQGRVQCCSTAAQPGAPSHPSPPMISNAFFVQGHLLVLFLFFVSSADRVDERAATWAVAAGAAATEPRSRRSVAHDDHQIWYLISLDNIE